VNIFAIDSATEACSVALLRVDGEVFGEFEIAPREHTRLLPEMMRLVLANASLQPSDLSHCAFTNGPGAFTGIRIAAAQAQGIGIGLNIPLIPVSTLAVLAQTCFDRYPYNSTLAALDARMQEIYWACYHRDSNGFAVLSGRERLGPFAELCAQLLAELLAERRAESGVGHGWIDEPPGAPAIPIDATLLPDARSLLKLATQAISVQQIVAASDISINYLRNQVAEKARR
jgi:tRNA threonylcarbamoyladenosine biosynthesis protein TsaB